MVDIGELAIKPEVNIDHRHPIEAVELLEIGNLLPSLRQQQLEGIYRHGAHVGVGRKRAGLLALDATNLESLHRAIGIELDLAQRGIQVNFPATGFDVIDDRLAQALRWVAIKEGHLGAITLLQEAI